jgi:hypothetical protein
MQKLKGELEKANRSLSERRTSQRLGDMEELKIYNALQRARPQDKITRVPKGKEGADITQFFNDKRKKFGSVLWEVKNKSTFQRPDITKLLDDQREAGTDCGVLVLLPCAFPPGIAPVAQPYEGVWLCPSDHVVPFMETLRRATFDLSQAKALNDDAERAGSAARARSLERASIAPAGAASQRGCSTPHSTGAARRLEAAQATQSATSHSSV